MYSLEDKSFLTLFWIEKRQNDMLTFAKLSPTTAIPLVILALFAAIPAESSSLYTIDFTSTIVGPTPTSGLFDYDSTLGTFVDFTVVWDGDTFDLNTNANAEPFQSTTDPCYSGATTGAQQVFLLLTACSTDANPVYYTGSPEWFANNDIDSGYTVFGFQTTPTTGPIGFNHVLFQYFDGVGPSIADANGGFESATPEPGSYALMLIGLGWLARKRIAHALRSARARL
jgi:hypothetical protein